MAIYRVIEPRIGRLRLREWRSRALGVFGLLLAIVFACTVGLVLFDDSSAPLAVKFVQALWNALNLVTTLGDFSPFDHRQKLFMMFVTIGVAMIGAYAVAQLTGILSSPEVLAYRENRAMEKTLQQLADHVVVVGYVQLGHLLAQRLAEAGRTVVVIERDEAAAVLASEHGMVVVKGDAGVDDDTLQRAGIARARALLVATNDADRNLAITLMAHTANPELHVVACGADARRAELLRRAGATEVVAVDGLLADAMLGRLSADGG